MSSQPSLTAGDVGASASATLHNILVKNEQITLRLGTQKDSAICGSICFEAFKHIATQHAFPPDFSSPEAASSVYEFAVAQPGTHVVVAEVNGQVVGSNMSWEQTPISGIGPITVSPSYQNASVGRKLMEHVLARSAAPDRLGIRLVQAAYHNRSLALYTRLGFASREPLSVFNGTVVSISVSGRTVRPADEADIEQCSQLHERLHGFSRAGDLRPSISRKTASVVECNGKITGYATGIGFFDHAIGESTDDIMALLGSATEIAGPGFLVPTRNARLMNWCLDNGFRIIQPMTLMTKGFYQEPEGSYLPSILF